MSGEYAEDDSLSAFEEEDEARARSMALRFGIDFDAPPIPPKQRKTRYRHPFINGDTDG
jgi:hypothetical protein